MAFIPGVRLICHWLLPAFVPTMFRPLSCSPEATTQHPSRVIRWSHNTYITHYYAAAALIPERLRWNIARAGNRLPLAIALLFRRLSFGSGASTSTPSSMSDGLISRWSGAQLRIIRFDPAIASAIVYTEASRRAAKYPAKWASTAGPRRISAAALCTT